MPETVQAVLDEVKAKRTEWTEKQWDDETLNRGLQHKFDKQLVAAKDDLLVNLNIIITKIDDPVMWGGGAEMLDALTDRRENIKQKITAVDKEQELRAGGATRKAPVGTTYYCDYINGSDGNDGLTTGNSWKTLGQFTSVTVRSPGDILKLRANIIWDYGAGGEDVNIIADEAGTITDNIEVKGCDSVDDPWGDASDVKPVIDFDGAAHYFNWGGAESYWTFRNIELMDGAATNNGMFYTSWVNNLSFYDLLVHGGTTYGMNFGGNNSFLVEDCEFHTNGSYSIQDSGGATIYQSCVFNGGSGGGTNYAGLFRNTQYFIDCSFGQTTAHNSGSIYSTWGVVYCQNCLMDTDEGYVAGGVNSRIVSEDHNQVGGDSRCWSNRGLVRSERTILRSGGSGISAAMEPSTSAASTRWDRYLRLGNNVISGGLKVWCSASATTVTVYIRSKEVWSVYPTNSELFIQASYLSDGSTGERSQSTPSTQVLADETTWVAFTTTFTPSQAGWAYIQVSLGKSQSTRGAYVDTEPLTS